MNKTLLVAVLFLIIGFGAGAFIYKNKKEPVEISNTQINSNQVAQNKLFALLDSFNDYPGHTFINNINTNLGLAVVQYPDEIPDIDKRGGGDGGRTMYAVYDYRDDKLYKDLGGYGLGGGEYPEGIINDHQILIVSNNDEISSKLVVQDFKNNTIQDLSIKLTPKNTIESGVAENGSMLFWIKGGTSIDGSYTLDTKTLELKKYR